MSPKKAKVSETIPQFFRNINFFARNNNNVVKSVPIDKRNLIQYISQSKKGSEGLNYLKKGNYSVIFQERNRYNFNFSLIFKALGIVTIFPWHNHNLDPSSSRDKKKPYSLSVKIKAMASKGPE